MAPDHIRNFCIIAHIDHGKSTLADRLLEATHAVSAREMTEQFLDSMDLERERGITIKAQAVRMDYEAEDGKSYQINLIDTPGHVDFSYEVSRSLKACEGALLVVDASQGIQAQTLANVYLALDQDLTIIPVINKIDLPVAEPERVAAEMERAFGFDWGEIIMVSAKQGTGVTELLEAIVERIPPPKGNVDAPLQGLIFDSKYDPYKGVLAYTKIVNGSVKAADSIRMMGTNTTADVLEAGVFHPQLVPTKGLQAGEVGYVATGLKDVRECRVGDTITLDNSPASEALAGYQPLKPMVFAGLYPADGESYPALRDALEKLQLNDAALTFEAESSVALGFGFRCGFLGLLHMEIVQERLEREFDLNIIVTSPSVRFRVLLTNGNEVTVHNPTQLPPLQDIDKLLEPWLSLTIVVPSRFIGAVMELLSERHGEFRRMEYMEMSGEENDGLHGPSSDARVLMDFAMPLAQLLVGFYDQLKSRTQGYASLDYQFQDEREGDLVKLDILVNGDPIDALSTIVRKDEAYEQGKAVVERLRKAIPRQMFDVALQAAVGSRIISRESIKALRKNVLAKCYGGDVSRKKKLLEKQAEGKKRMKRVGKVDVPQEAFMTLLKIDRQG
ncbi:MAG: GTP-binding protein LepA [Chloroflexi bacterium]|jgi:GTP-binding protein LepA|nr:MAG: GTP-binding protein LepA [Chloroflexota bacterium]